MRYVVLAAAGFVGLAALTACKGEEETAAQGSTTCDPATFEFLVGQDKSVLESVTTPEVTRVLGATDAATTDFQENRLTVVHDADGKIMKVSCG